MKFKSNIELQAGLEDNNAASGTPDKYCLLQETEVVLSG